MLYERLIGFQEPKITIHGFFGVMQEYVLGNITSGQAKTVLGLDDAEAAEAVTLLNRINEESSNQSAIARRVKALEFEKVLIMAEEGVVYTTVAAVKARLGV